MPCHTTLYCCNDADADITLQEPAATIVPTADKRRTKPATSSDKTLDTNTHTHINTPTHKHTHHHRHHHCKKLPSSHNTCENVPTITRTVANREPPDPLAGGAAFRNPSSPPPTPPPRSSEAPLPFRGFPSMRFRRRPSDGR